MKYFSFFICLYAAVTCRYHLCMWISARSCKHTFMKLMFNGTHLYFFENATHLFRAFVSYLQLFQGKQHKWTNTPPTCAERQVVWDTQHHLWSLNCRFQRLSATSWWSLCADSCWGQTVLTEFCSERKTVTNIVIRFPILVFQIIKILVIVLCLYQTNMFSNIFSIMEHDAVLSHNCSFLQFGSCTFHYSVINCADLILPLTSLMPCLKAPQQ